MKSHPILKIICVEMPPPSGVGFRVPEKARLFAD